MTRDPRDLIYGKDVPPTPQPRPAVDDRATPHVDAVVERPRVRTSLRHRVKVVHE